MCSGTEDLSNRSRSWPPPAEFWQHEFLDATGDGWLPFLFKTLVPTEIATADDVVLAFRRLCQLRQTNTRTPARLRIYLDEDRRDDLAILSTTTDFGKDESLSAFVHRITGRPRFCMVINNLELLSERLCANLGDFLQSMFAVRGVPIGGSEQVAFAGNYEGTAFGVHKGHEHAFLLHLGPATKDFYCWSKADFVRLTGGDAPIFGDYRWLLDHGQKFVLEPGDVLYLPADVYHVGRQCEFSVSIAVPLYTYPQAKYFLLGALPELAASLLSQLEQVPSPHERLAFDDSPLSDSLQPVAEELLKKLHQHAADRLPAILARYWFGLVSNGGWEVADSSVPAAATTEAPIYGVKLRKPYKICWDIDATSAQLRVFLRGRGVLVPYHPDLPVLFARLNDGQDVVFDAPNAPASAFARIFETGGLDILS